MELIYTFVMFATSYTSHTLSFTTFDLVLLTTLTGVACELTLCKKILFEIVSYKLFDFRKHYWSAHQIVISLQDNGIGGKMSPIPRLLQNM